MQNLNIKTNDFIQFMQTYFYKDLTKAHFDLMTAAVPSRMIIDSGNVTFVYDEMTEILIQKYNRNIAKLFRIFEVQINNKSSGGIGHCRCRTNKVKDPKEYKKYLESGPCVINIDDKPID